MSADLRAKALKLEVAKRYGEAAAIYRQMGLLDKAAYMYQKAGQMDSAVDLYGKAGRFQKAAEMCERLERWGDAAKWREKAKEFIEAGRLYQLAGIPTRAAEAYERAGDWRRAGEAHLQAGSHARAGAAFSKAGDTQRAASAYATLSEKASASGSKRSVEDLRRAARTLEAGGEFSRAASLYLEATDAVGALHAAARGNDPASAAQIYLKRLQGRGYEVVRDIPAQGKAYKNYAAMFILTGEFQLAAHVWENFGEFIKAAELYERIGDEAMSAETFLRGHDLERAAMMFTRCGEHLRAAELFLQAENHDWAAECFEKADMPYEAGREYFLSEQFEKAIEMLQKVEEGSMEHFDASVMLCRAYRAKGFSDLALERYKKILDTTPLSRDTMDFYYELALLYRTKRAYERAEDILKQIVHLQFGYKDAVKLLQEVQSMRAIATASAPPLAAASADSRPAASAPRASERGQSAPPPDGGQEKPTDAEPALGTAKPSMPAGDESKSAFSSWLQSVKKDKTKG
ncbi:MAG: hypothetical protein JSV08_01725 [Acidobacteriota bacterium]|nr:MAG: hypothetical protein JSV08_01725 [Acidobacteriota bacterium]